MSVDPREMIARRMALQGPVYAGRPPAKCSVAMPEAPSAHVPAPALERPLMLDFVMSSGNRVSMSYAYLNTVEYDPSEGLTLRFMQAVVTVKGSGLKPLHEGIRDHRTAAIEEGADDVFDGGSMGSDRQTRIDRITIERRSPEV